MLYLWCLVAAILILALLFDIARTSLRLLLTLRAARREGASLRRRARS
jgi:hypothetical protein